MTEKLETEIIRAEKHCVSCLHWDGVICAVFRKRKEGRVTVHPGGGWNTSRTRRFLQKRRVGDEEVKKSGFPVWTVNRKASR